MAGGVFAGIFPEQAFDLKYNGRGDTARATGSFPLSEHEDVIQLLVEADEGYWLVQAWSAICRTAPHFQRWTLLGIQRGVHVGVFTFQHTTRMSNNISGLM